jgi:hypothetical protein
MSMANRTNTVFFLLWGFASVALAQTTLPPEGRTQPRASALAKLSHNARQFANDYHEILENVRDIYSDYGDYFDDLDNPRLDKIQSSLNRTGLALERGSYNSDPTGLKTNMENLARLCAQFEKEAGHSAPDRKALKLSRTLENDLEQLVFDLNEIIDEQSEFSSAEKIAIGHYISDSLSLTFDVDMDRLSRQIEELAKLSAKLAGKATEQVLDSLRREMELAYAEFEENKKSASRSGSGKSVTIVLPKIPDAPDIPDASGHPAPFPAPARVAIGGHSVVVHSEDEVTVSSHLEGTHTLERRQMPVKIVSPYGNIVVRGVSGRTITANCEVTVASRTEKEARNASRQVGLSTMGPNGAAVIQLNIPGFDDARTRVASSRMVVEVPEECDLTIDCRFGTTEISEISGVITIHGDHSQVAVVQSRGTLAIDNAMGEIRVEVFHGNATVENSHANIFFDDIRGDIAARNAYATTSVARSRGNVNFICKGMISIEDHRGNAVIENSTGSASIRDIRGDVKLVSSFGEVQMENVEGTVNLQSKNGTMRLTNIEGACIVESQAGNFEASNLAGPLSLTNIDGVAKLDLSIPLDAASTVKSTRGRITIGIAETSDIQVKARTIRGSIRGASRLRIVERGTIYTAEGIWGSSNSTLTITGEDATIQIEDN